MADKYEYLLHTWGGFYNDEHKVIHQKEAGYFFFDTNEEREKYIKELQDISEIMDAQVLMIDRKEGIGVRYKTVAHLILKYKGEKFELEYDFGYAYPSDAALFMFEDGNYACDCNRSSFIIEKYGNKIPDLPCGNEIKLVSIEIKKEKVG